MGQKYDGALRANDLGYLSELGKVRLCNASFPAFHLAHNEFAFGNGCDINLVPMVG